MDFPAVFLDEASMSTEPASLIPLMLGVRYTAPFTFVSTKLCLQSQHVALIGDHKQLPPVITSTLAQEGGLSRSLFERLIEQKSESNRERIVCRSLIKQNFRAPC
jgi:superfamily I DNA and/or RNA helicase